MAMRDHFGDPDQRQAAAAAHAAAKTEKSRSIEDQSHLGTSSDEVGEVQNAVGSQQAAQAAAEAGIDEDDWTFSFIKINRIQVCHFSSSSLAF
jgi:hypothetical protein